MKVVKRPQFLLDLGEELVWLKNNAGVDVAERWYQALLVTLRFIEENPFAGREREDLSPAGIRSWRLQGFPRWLIFYTVSPGKKVIFYRIRSGTMNLVVLKIKS